MTKRAVASALGLAWICLALGIGACSDDDEGPKCPNVAGGWVIAQHCDTSAVGRAFVVEQNECSLSTNGIDIEFRGSVAPSGEVSVQGSLVGVPIQCSGTATSVRVTLNCGGCSVTLER